MDYFFKFSLLREGKGLLAHTATTLVIFLFNVAFNYILMCIGSVRQIF
jgi:hypothetical protein